MKRQQGAGDPRNITAWGMVPTPFTRTGDVDHASLHRVVTHLRSCGCDGFIALGAIAEPGTLSRSEKVDIVRTIAVAAGSAPVAGAVLALEPERFDADLNALSTQTRDVLSAIMIPVNSPDPDLLEAAIEHAGLASGLPVILQDLPRFSGVHIDTSDLAAAVSASSCCMAVKCEAPPTYERIRFLSEHTSTALISGFGGLGLVDDVIAGASSVAIGSTPTREVVEAMRRALDGRYEEASAMIGTVASRIHFETQPGANVAIRKRYWQRAGVIETHVVRQPTRGFGPELEEHSLVHHPAVSPFGLTT
ncbi:MULTISPECIES: dihydrodipicolinate synthase family protein [Gordonia]|uniref:dihydrodipicolinate synthase family protein n=1 Tax=Gordonia TaxID=2053 RepID=UPI00339AE7B1